MNGTSHQDQFDECIGAVEVSVQNIGSINQNNEVETNQLVDPDNLYPACAFDQQKLMLGDDCEVGIGLFCRHELFPETNTTNAPQDTFKEICRCIDTLCDGLPSSNSIGKHLHSLSRIIYIILGSASFIGLFITSLTLLNLFYHRRHRASKFIPLLHATCNAEHCCFIVPGSIVSRFVLFGLFFLSAFVYFFFKITLSNVLPVMEDVSTNFLFERHQGLTRDDFFFFVSKQWTISYDEFYYYYFNGSDFNESDFYEFDFNESDFNGSDFYEFDFDDKYFLNNESINAIPGGMTFKSIEQHLRLSMLVWSVYRCAALICFLDIGILWIESSRLVSGTRKQRLEKFNRFRMFIRIMELLLLSSAIMNGVFLTIMSAEGYWIFDDVLLCATSIIIICLFSIGRYRLTAILSKGKRFNCLDPKLLEYSITIRKIAMFVVLANIGIIIAQMYKLSSVHNYEDLIRSNNESFSIGIFVMQDIVLMIGFCAVFYYVLKSHVSNKFPKKRLKALRKSIRNPLPPRNPPLENDLFSDIMPIRRQDPCTESNDVSFFFRNSSMVEEPSKAISHYL